ncbi:hypothetical protein HRUBRA_01108 [Pseudohaliea rubra DSM 19751]|uniref:Arsenical resistance operon repressor n=1 Tax=Pseudohaliea rubra DSM 19751 TaxID=1265313 RepID=A0A095X039_9GAMM|nr:hypothetical protein HRUBRA_01108 [Pseudohaliea rubra DSM 19751]
MRHCELLADERRGQWVYYRLHPALPAWVLAILKATATAEADAIDRMQERLTPALPGATGREVDACA